MIWPFKLFSQKIQEQPSTKERSWSEGFQFGGMGKFVQWNPDDLIGWKGFGVYRRMMEDDQVKASFELVRNMICSRTWKFDVKEDDPEQEKIRDFFMFNLEEILKGTFTQALKGILLAKAHGFSLSEKIYRTVEHEGTVRWVIDAIKPKPFETFQLERDDFGNLINVVQNQLSRDVRIPPSKFIYYVHQADIDPIWGRSDFKAAYPAYWSKKNISKFWDIYDERLSGGTWAFKAKDDAPATSPAEAEDIKSILRSMTAQTGVIVPAGYDLDILQPNDTDAFANHINYLDKRISKAMLVPNLLGFSEQQSTGSFAQAEVQLNVFMDMIKAEGDQLADTLNEQLFKELAFWNFGTHVFPKFTFEAFTEKQKQGIVDKWVVAVKDGAVINTYEDELTTRSLLGYPSREEEDNEPIQGTEEEEEVEKKEVKVEKKQEKIEEVKASSSVDGSWSSPTLFVNKDDDAAITRVDFPAIGTSLDKQQSTFVKDMAKDVDKMFSELNSTLRLVYKDITEKENVNAKTEVKKLDKAISSESKASFNNTVKSNLRISYNSGRAFATEEMRESTKGLPEKFAERISMAVMMSPKRALKFHDDNVWTVAQFVEGITTQEAEKILSATGFFITGVVSEDMLNAAKQALLSGIENGKSINDIVEDLKEVLSPLVGKAERNPETGKLEIDKKERARLETIARTNISTVFNQSQLSVFTDPDLGDFVEAFEYTALLDTRTTSFCRGYDEFIRPKNDPIWSQITPPNHFNCRSRLVAVTAVDVWESSKDLPKENGELLQQGRGFGSIKQKNEL